MRNTTVLGAGALLLSLPLLSSTIRPGEKPEPGSPAPEIEARTWYNHIGKMPALENLRGRAVLIEFWATW